MLEKAIFISAPRNLKYVDTAYSRLYFGIEFCERLMPSIEDVSSVVSFAAKNNMAFTFVTPFVTDKGITMLEPVIDYLSDKQETTEIVVNDWGFLNLLRRKNWKGSLSLGRLLTKQKRGPRIMNVLKRLPKGAIEHFRQSNIDVPVLSEFLLERNIKRVELDNLLQGISRPHAILKGSLYYPYLYVTTTRYCLTASCESKTTNYRLISSCNKQCQKYEFELSHRSMPVKLLLKGNTQFFINDKIPDNLESLNIDRLVFEPEIPV